MRAIGAAFAASAGKGTGGAFDVISVSLDLFRLDPIGLDQGCGPSLPRTTILLDAGSHWKGRKGFEMRQLDGIQPAGTRLEFESSEIDQEGRLEVRRRARGASEIAIGTPEHAALVEAVRREFPEIYDLTAKCASVRRF